MVYEFIYVDLSRQFRLWKRVNNYGFETDYKDENGRKGPRGIISKQLPTSSSLSNRPLLRSPS